MREPCSANCLAAGSCPRESMISGRLTCLCQGQGEASLYIIPNALPLLSHETISCFSLLTDRFLLSPVIGSRGVNPAHGPEAAIAQVIREVLGGADYLLGQGWQLGQPGDREETADPAGGSEGNGIPVACEKKQPWGLETGSASGKETRWELLTREGVRGPGAGHRGATAQTCWHKSQLQRARYSREHAPTLLLARTVHLSLWDSAPVEAVSAKGHIPWSLQTSQPSRRAVAISTGCESPQGIQGSFLIAFSCQNSY